MKSDQPLKSANRTPNSNFGSATGSPRPGLYANDNGSGSNTGQPLNPLRKLFEVNSANILLPLRLFLGISFLAAGFDKLFDPQFFDANSAGYIGNQLAGFAGQSPIAFLLNPLSSAPLASIVGASVLIGELAIGLATLLGLWSRVAALGGFILSIVLWLSASWNVTPFFLGSDLPYAMAWLTLVLAGAHPILSLDALLGKDKMEGVEPGYQPTSFGPYTSSGIHPVPAPYQASNSNYGRQPQGTSVTRVEPNNLNTANGSATERSRLVRRQFLYVTGGIILAGGFTGMAWLKSVHEEMESPKSQATELTLPTPTSNGSTSNSTPSGAPSTGPGVNTLGSAAATPVQTGPTPGPANTASPGGSGAAGSASTPTNAPATQAQPTPAITGKVIAKLSDIGIGSALAFRTPDTGENAYLVHAKDGSVKAFSRTCTHEGCDVSFVQSSQIFNCPCHGAQFDANTGAVLRRPARQPLQNFKVAVDGNGNVIYTS